MQLTELKKSMPLLMIVYLRMAVAFWEDYRMPVPLSDIIGYFPKWKASVGINKSPLNDRMPWLTFSAIDFLSKILTSDSKVFEYGAGGSSLFFAKIVNQIVSTEHNPEWFAITEKTIENDGYKNWIGHLAPATYDENLCGADPADPNLYVSSDAAFKCSSFQDYVLTIDKYPDEYFDLVVIDGRARPACAKRAMSKVKQHGYLILDNSERESYLLAHQLLNDNGWENYNFPGPIAYNYSFSQTSIWQKKQAELD